MTNEENVNI